MTKNEMKIYALMRTKQLTMVELANYLMDCISIMFNRPDDDGRYIALYKTLKCMQQNQKLL